MAEMMQLPALTKQLLALPNHQLWTDYDQETDTLYISFQKPQQANDSILEDDGNIYHYRDGALVGITVMHAFKWQRSG
jgi:uncharacterized protein YuzE